MAIKKLKKLKISMFLVPLFIMLIFSIIVKVKAAKDEDNICCFSMNDSLWNSLSNKYGINGMYLLNKIFLDYVVSLDCVFKLMAPPGLYYSQTIKRIVLGKENTSYANELEYINKKYFYGWNSNYEIGQIADRGK